ERAAGAAHSADRRYFTLPGLHAGAVVAAGQHQVSVGAGGAGTRRGIGHDAAGGLHAVGRVVAGVQLVLVGAVVHAGARARLGAHPGVVHPRVAGAAHRTMVGRMLSLDVGKGGTCGCGLCPDATGAVARLAIAQAVAGRQWVAQGVAGPAVGGAGDRVPGLGIEIGRNDAAHSGVVAAAVWFETGGRGDRVMGEEGDVVGAGRLDGAVYV